MDRIDRLEEDVRDIKKVLADMSPLLTRIDERLKHVADKSEVAALPKRWELIGLLIAFLGVTQIPSILGAVRAYNTPAIQAAGVINEPQGSNSQGKTEGVHQGTGQTEGR